MSVDVNKLNPLCKSIMNSDIMNEVKINRLTYDFQFNDEVVSKDIVSLLLLLSTSSDTYLNNYYSDEHINSFYDFINIAIKDNVCCIKEILPLVNEEYMDQGRLEDVKYFLRVYDDIVEIIKIKKNIDEFDHEKLEELVNKSNKGGLLKILNKKNKEKAIALDQSLENSKKELKDKVIDFQKRLFEYLEKRNERILEASFIKEKQ